MTDICLIGCSGKSYRFPVSIMVNVYGEEGWGWEVGEISSYASKAFQFQLISSFKNKKMLIPHIFSILFISRSRELHGCFPAQKMTTSQQSLAAVISWKIKPVRSNL